MTDVTKISRGYIWFRTGPPRRLSGLTVGGYALRFGVPIPPADGPVRAAILDADGRALLAQARREYGRVVREVLAVAGSAVPSPVDLARPWLPAAARDLVASRRLKWRQTRRRLSGRAPSRFEAAQILATQPIVDLGTLEQHARGALDSAIGAFDYLEDTPLAVDAHIVAHEIGELVAGLFGCRAERKDDKWLDTCRLSLMHLRLGMSAGFTARRHCSVCDSDLSDFDCDHIPGTAYAATAGRRQDGSCTICGGIDCATHSPGSVCTVVAHAVIREVDRLDEISAVPRPRDPLARPTSIEITAEAVARLPGSEIEDAVLHCERCAVPCTGFTSAEEALGGLIAEESAVEPMDKLLFQPLPGS